MFRSTDSRPSETGRPEKTRKARRTRPECQALEGRALMATLADIPNVDVPTRIGYQMPLIGGTANQTYTVQSDNPNIVATIAQGPYLTFHVTHTSSGANDPAFTGNITFQLFNDLTPDTVDHIARLVEQGFYTNKRFPRVASGFSDPPSPDGFIIQGGTITTSDTVNQPGFPFADEFVQQLAFTGNKQSTDTTSIYSVAGQLAMANSGSDTNGAQFFITTENPRFLDYKHTIFGQLVASDVVNGKTIVQLMTEVARNGETPINPIIIDTANLTNANPNGVVHIDATNAASGETATITVTATDPADSSTVTKTFDVNITDNATTERVFIDGTIQNQVVGLTTQTPVQGQSDVFAIPYVNPNGPTGQVAFKVAGSATSTGFTNVTNATATVDSNGIVTVKPNAGFTGVINLVVGVRNASAADAPSNYDLQNLTLTVTNTDAINLPPVAVTGTSTTVVGTPVAVQLLGNTANPEAQQTLTYEIVTPPAHGSLTGFDPATGKFTYVPNAGFQGEDTLQFRVKDSGDPGPSLTSQVATQYFVVDGGDTGAVRLISRVLVVTPPPSDNSVPNTIDVKLFNGKVQVFVNGELDAIQPKPEDLDRIVVFGSKKDDVITVSPDVEVPATLDGGHGGLNTIVAGGGSTVGHTWFGHNKITLGPAQDYVVGRAGGFRVLQPSDGDIAAAGKPRQMGSLHDRGKAPTFYYYKTLNGRLIRTARPIGSRQWLQLISPPDSTA